MYPILFRFPDWIPILGGEPISSFGLMLVVAFLAGAYLLAWGLEREGLDPERAWDIFVMCVIGGLGGAKLFDILLDFPRLLEEPAAVIFSREGLVWYGGFLTAAGLIVFQVRRLELPAGKVFDALATALPVAYALGRVGCFLVGDDYGKPTDSWVGIRFPEGFPPTRADILQSHFGVAVDPALIEKYGPVVPVHPTQLYEVGLSLLIFLVVWRLAGHRHRAGWLFMVYLLLAGMERFAVEFVRAKDDRFFGALTLSQVIALGLVAVGIAGVAAFHRSAPEAAPAAAE